MTRPLSRRQKYRIYNSTIEQLEARWQCKTCSGVIEHDDAIYCRHCRMYWEDVANGLFNFDEDSYSPALANETRGGTGDDCSVGKRGVWPHHDRQVCALRLNVEPEPDATARRDGTPSALTQADRGGAT